MYPIILLPIIFAITVPFFLSRTLSPIPYFPTNKADVPIIATILHELVLKNRTNRPVFIVDLGAGTGEVLFEASQQGFEPPELKGSSGRSKKPTKFILIENNPWLALILQIKRLFHPNKDAIEILRANMFKDKLPYASIVYIYVGPYVMDRVKKLLEKMESGTYVVSYFYEIPGWEKKLIKKVSGKHEVFVYQL